MNQDLQTEQSKKLKSKKCPKCGYIGSSIIRNDELINKLSTVENRDECPNCGVVYKNVELGPPALVTQWSKILEDFDNDDLHNELIKLAEQRKHLPWVHERYTVLNAHLGGDEMCARMIERINLNLSYMPKATKSSSKLNLISNFITTNQRVILFLGLFFIIAVLSLFVFRA